MMSWTRVAARMHTSMKSIASGATEGDDWRSARLREVNSVKINRGNVSRLTRSRRSIAYQNSIRRGLR